MSYLLKLSPGSAISGDVYLVDPERRSTGERYSRLDEAIDEARVLLENAQDEARALREQAFDRGYTEGLETAQQQYSAAMKETDDLKQALLEEREAFFACIEPQVVKLSVEIAEKMLGHELESNPEAVLDIVKFALLQLTDRESIKLRISPDDAKVIKEHREEIQDSAGGIRQIEIIEDRRVDPGGCVAESSSGSLDARIKSQISEVTRALTEATGDDGDSDYRPE